MAEFILFGTEGCHLCEEAEMLIRAAGIVSGKQDILDDEQWQTLYAIRIPVLLHVLSGLELTWPFSAEQLTAFVASTSGLRQQS